MTAPVQFEARRSDTLPSDPPMKFDVTKETTVHLTVGQLVRIVMLIALVVMSVAAVLPNILPKKYTIATQTYVEESVSAAHAEAEAKVASNTEKIQTLTDGVGLIQAKVEDVEHVQIQARAAQEADRVTRHIRNGDRRVAEYHRVYEAGVRNLKSKREPLEGVRLE